MPPIRLALVPTLLALGACPSGGGGAGPPGSFSTLCSSAPAPAASASAACNAYLDAFSARSHRCGITDAVDVLLTQTEFGAYCVALLGAPGVAPVAAQLALCASKVRDLPCEQDTDVLCECASSTLRGTLADGAACGADNQCASGNCMGSSSDLSAFSCGHCAPAVAVGGKCGGTDGHCGSDATCVSKVCRAQRMAKENEPCDGTTEELVRCERGLYCGSRRTDGGSVGVCLRPSAEGGPCGSCSGSLRCVNAVCQRPQAQGGSCRYSSDCVSNLTCDDTSRCAPATILSEGQACNGAVLGKARCGDNLFCTSSSSTSEGVCKAYKRKGEPCAAGDRCILFTVCQGGTCIVPDPSTCR